MAHEDIVFQKAFDLSFCLTVQSPWSFFVRNGFRYQLSIANNRNISSFCQLDIWKKLWLAQLFQLALLAMRTFLISIFALPLIHYIHVSQISREWNRGCMTLQCHNFGGSLVFFPLANSRGRYCCSLLNNRYPL